jgi:hypothetical protein
VALELAPGIYGGEKGLAAYLDFMGVDSVDELGQDVQLTLEENDERDHTQLPERRAA